MGSFEQAVTEKDSVAQRIIEVFGTLGVKATKAYVNLLMIVLRIRRDKDWKK